jgi:DNA-binding NarL/FixJ family response regulator
VEGRSRTGDAIAVVLCDDVPQLRVLLRFALEEHGDITVVGEAGDGATGVEMVRDMRPDAVLLDLSMPGMDGLEAIPRIRAASADAAIVVFSGFAAERMSAEALRLGADRYIEKGAPLEHVRGVVREAVDARRDAAAG